MAVSGHCGPMRTCFTARRELQISAIIYALDRGQSALSSIGGYLRPGHRAHRYLRPASPPKPRLAWPCKTPFALAHQLRSDRCLHFDIFVLDRHAAFVGSYSDGGFVRRYPYCRVFYRRHLQEYGECRIRCRWAGALRLPSPSYAAFRPIRNIAVRRGFPLPQERELT